MTLGLCVLCRKRPAGMIYEVQSGRPKEICGACFGQWDPVTLNGLLGVKPDGEGHANERQREILVEGKDRAGSAAGV